MMVCMSILEIQKFIGCLTGGGNLYHLMFIGDWTKIWSWSKEMVRRKNTAYQSSERSWAPTQQRDEEICWRPGTLLKAAKRSGR